jgi:ribosome-associated toxin RatA of RatAB toxin-antitoxin module
MMRQWCVAGALVLGGGLSAAHADELGDLLKAGPLVRVEQGENQKFKRVLAMADVAAPAELVWEVLNNQEKYPEFMPRLKKLTIKDEAPNVRVLSYVLDTPFADTTYALRWTANPAEKTVTVKHAGGDLKGSEYDWRIVSLGPETSRIFYGGVTRNFSSMATRLEDDQQTITVGVNVVGVLAAAKAIKGRSETIHRARKAAGTPSAATAGATP